jgi:predicted RNA binding protein YcfA (HicA-like mRNA interferase family)
MRVTVPMHAGRTVRLGTLARIIESAGLTIDEFIELL